jgi:protein-disulfide isomerase
MAIPVLAWIIIKPGLLISQQISPLKSQLRQYKYNKYLFDKLLKDEVQYALPDYNNTVVIGNPEAEKVITMVSNPYCQPCAKAHKGLQWLNGRDDVKLQIVFTTQNETERNAEVALHLMALQQSNDGVSLKKALDDWYSQKQKSYSAWAKLYPKPMEISDFEPLNKQREWCNLTEVKGTPTLFLNGRKLPQNYQPEDLKYFI